MTAGLSLSNEKNDGSSSSDIPLMDDNPSIFAVVSITRSQSRRLHLWEPYCSKWLRDIIGKALLLV